MNANELADMAENACCAYQKEIATMLRQQQAEIEALKAEREFMFGYVKSRGEVGQLIVYKASLEAQEKCNGFCGEYECKENQSICKRKAQEK